MGKKESIIPIKNLFYMLCYAWNILAIKDDIQVADDDYEDAIKKFKILEEYGDERAHLDLADCYYCLGEYEEAMVWADKADYSKMDPEEDGYLFFVLGDIYNENRQFEKAHYWAKLAVFAGEEEAKDLLEAVEEELKLQE